MKRCSVMGLVACFMAAVIGCQSAPKEPASMDDAVLELAQSLVQKALADKHLAGPKIQVMAIGRIVNDTMAIRRDSFEFMKSQIAAMLSDSGKVVIADDKASGLSGKRPPAPTLLLAGKLTQRNSRGENGTARSELFLELSIMDAASGVRLWNDRKAAAFVVDKDASGW